MCLLRIFVIIRLVHSSPPSDGVGVVQSKLPEAEKGLDNRSGSSYDHGTKVFTSEKGLSSPDLAEPVL